MKPGRVAYLESVPIHLKQSSLHDTAETSIKHTKCTITKII